MAGGIEELFGCSIDQGNPLLNGFKQSECAATEINGNTRGFTVSFPHIRTTPIQCQVHDEKSYYSMDGVSGHAGLFSTLSDNLEEFKNASSEEMAQYQQDLHAKEKILLEVENTLSQETDKKIEVGTQNAKRGVAWHPLRHHDDEKP